MLGGRVGTEKKIPLVKWNDVCRPNDEAGLGLRDAMAMNKAYMAKLGWHMLNNQDALWVRVLRGKYLAKGAVNFLNSQKSNLSPTWRAILD